MYAYVCTVFVFSSRDFLVTVSDAPPPLNIALIVGLTVAGLIVLGVIVSVSLYVTKKRWVDMVTGHLIQTSTADMVPCLPRFAGCRVMLQLIVNT